MATEIVGPCLGIELLGQCSYDPSKPFGIYFSLGEVVGALAFTLAAQQLLKPVYQLRLASRNLSTARLYGCVFLGTLAVIVASLLPNFPAAHGGIWGYPIVWEVLATTLFVSAYVAVICAAILPVSVRERTIISFSIASAHLLSAASEADHVDYVPDLGWSLPTLIECSAFTDNYRWREHTAFYEFRFRNQIERAGYAASLLTVFSDPSFCSTLVRRAAWPTAQMMRDISERRLYGMAAAQFVREVAHQAVLRDDGMMARESGYTGFRAAPLLSESLFSSSFIIERYDPFDWDLSSDDLDFTALRVLRFNKAVERAVNALIQSRMTNMRVQAMFSIEHRYKDIFRKARDLQTTVKPDYELLFAMSEGARLAADLAQKIEQGYAAEYERHFSEDPKTDRFSDALHSLVDTVFDALLSISNEFAGYDDHFWSMAIELIGVFPSNGEAPDGLSPFQQRLAIKLIDKLKSNMDGWYPAISRVLLGVVGPYRDAASQPNRTAFNILRDAVYQELKRLPSLAAEKPEKLRDFLPANVTYDVETTILTHHYRNASITTDLSALTIPAVSLTDPTLRAALVLQPKA